MLQVVEGLPERLLAAGAREVGQRLSGPTLFHIPGRRREPLFVSVLLHGNEDTGWEAVRKVLTDSMERELPRALSLFIGNVAAAAENRRYLAGQADYNRIWSGGGSEEHALAGQVLAEMAARRVFASIDIHNNTGLNPHYACLYRLDNPSLNLAVLFGRTVVYARKPDGAQTQAFAGICPSVTIECGQQGLSRGIDHARQFVTACLNLSEVRSLAVPDHDLDLYHTVAVVKVRDGVDFSFGGPAGRLSFRPDLDRLNFQLIAKGTVLGRLDEPPGRVLTVSDESGEYATEHYFQSDGRHLLTRVPVMPSMFTTSVEAVRQDCLGYFMEKMSYRHLAGVIEGGAEKGL